VLVPVKDEVANYAIVSPASRSRKRSALLIRTDDTQAIAETAGARVTQVVWNGKLPRKKIGALENLPCQHE